MDILHLRALNILSLRKLQRRDDFARVVSFHNLEVAAGVSAEAWDHELEQLRRVFGLDVGPLGASRCSCDSCQGVGR